MYSGENMVGNRKTKNIKMRCPLKSESTGNIEKRLPNFFNCEKGILFH